MANWTKTRRKSDVAIYKGEKTWQPTGGAMLSKYLSVKLWVKKAVG